MKNVTYITAGAGSGKTHTLTNKLVELVQKGYQPSEIVLTTFTELAASEFKERAREELLKSGNYQSAVMLDTASIGTVHGVCLDFIKKYWFILGISPKIDVISENHKKSLINQSLSDISSSEDIESFQALHETFRFTSGIHSIEAPDYWKGHLQSVIEKSEQYGIDDFKSSKEDSVNLIRAIFSKTSSFDYEQSESILRDYLEICTSKDRTETIRKFLNDKAYTNLLGLAKVKPTGKELQVLPEIDSLISDASDEIQSSVFGKQLEDYVSRIFDIADKWNTHYKQFKKGRGLVDYNDMERLFLELLEFPDVVSEIKDSCKIVLVDEFQDSSPLQVKIFSKLSQIAEKSIWVGDPKQAIYGFRGGDSKLTDAVRNIFLNEKSENGLVMGEPLGDSHRSLPPLVKLSNEVFGRAFADSMDPEHIKLNPVRSNGTIQKPLRHWHVSKGEGRASNAERFKGIAQQVIGLLESDGGIKGHEIAVLLRKNSDVADLAEVLKGYGVKVVSSAEKDEEIKQKAEFRLVIALLNYVLNQSNSLAKAEILHLLDEDFRSLGKLMTSRHSFLNDAPSITEETSAIVQPLYSKDWESSNSLIRDLDFVIPSVSGLPVPELIQSLFLKFDVRGKVAKWGTEHERFRNLDQIIQMAINYDAQCLVDGTGSSLNDFIVLLQNDFSIENKIEPTEGAVNVLTYHKSKGLQWKVVVLESLDYDSLNESEMIRKSFFGVSDFYVETPNPSNLFPERRIQLLPWFLGSKQTSLPENITNVINQTDYYRALLNSERNELKRLLYVGVTRAKDYLITTSYHNKELTWLSNASCPEEIKPGECNSNKLDVFGCSIDFDFELVIVDEDFEAVDTTSDMKVMHKSMRTETVKDLVVNPSKLKDMPAEGVAALVIKKFQMRIPTKRDSSVEDDSFGNCLHDIFCAYRKEFSEQESLSKVIRILGNHLMLNVFPDKQAILKSVENLWNWLETSYGTPSRVEREMPIQHKTKEGQIVKGVIDMLWYTDNGVVLIDVKSYQGSESDIMNRNGSNYAGKHIGQFDTYKEVLTAAGQKVTDNIIYYPVSGIVVELSTTNG